MKLRRREQVQSGFTIVELMIATSVLAVMLLLVTIILSSLGNLYYKEANQSRIQDDARNVVSQITQDLELNGGSVQSGVGAFCIDGSIRYSYVIGQELGTESTHVLWRDTDPNPANCTSANLALAQPSATGVELLAPSSRLTQFSISLTSPYTITINVAYGDDDLLCSPSASGTCTSRNNTMTPGNFRDGDIICKGVSDGDSYCATATLTTTVVQRLTGG
jgi:prepilin-type N-terminal cleavage/methylation domain-containing protein